MVQLLCIREILVLFEVVDSVMVDWFVMVSDFFVAKPLVCLINYVLMLTGLPTILWIYTVIC